MTRWMRGYRGKQMAVKRVTRKLMEHPIVPSLEDEEFEWPTEYPFLEAQDSFKESRNGHSLRTVK